MFISSVLVGLAALVVVASALCWLAGVQTVALVKIFLGVIAVGLTLAATAVFTGEVLYNGGYLNSGSADVSHTPVVTQTQPVVETQETQGLRWLHHHTVGVFIEGPGFGMRRMPVVLDDIVARSQSSTRQAAGWGSGPYVRVAVAGEEANNTPVRTHFVAQTELGRSLFGGVVAGDYTDGRKATWQVRKVNLVGLVKHPRPVVYLTDDVPDMKTAKDVPTRNLDAFETAALAAIRGGQTLEIDKHDNVGRMMGPIYAGQNCVKCHDQRGQLLGAFTYQLERVPVEKGAEAKD